MIQEEVDRLRKKAMARVKYAIKVGALPRITKKTKCVDCGDRAIEYEHRDYYKPLEVQPVCRKCNMARGPAHPVAEDRYDRSAGWNWNGLNDGEGIEWTFTGALAIDIDLRAIEEEIAKALRVPDPDVKIANLELGKLQNVKAYRRSINNIKRSSVVTDDGVFVVEYRRRWPSRKNAALWSLKSIKQELTFRSEKILASQP